MKKEDLLKLIDDNVPDGADIEMTIATKDDNYSAMSDQPVINEYSTGGGFELVLELPDVFEVNTVRTQSKVEVPITECDLELFKGCAYDNSTFDWTFPDQHGNQINVEFMSQDEFDQRGK